MSSTGEPTQSQNDPPENIDPVWMSSRTSRQIYALGEVEKDISRLLSLAASSMSLLTLPQTDEPGDGLPQGEERSEQFVLEVSEYFQRLDSIQIAIRSSLAHIRQSRIAPSAITAPPAGFIPRAQGVGLPNSVSAKAGTSASTNGPTSNGAAAEVKPKAKMQGLQEERIERDAWRGILDALTRLRDARDSDQQPDMGEDIVMEG
ncbi:hypothetical protein OF83DRAFT_14152 [Amylostereum chailletii]|nr:hypothetical protein OF83DRAFT_14152 [Amylostereum chailletii]